jgi:hypothetical protein
MESHNTRHFAREFTSLLTRLFINPTSMLLYLLGCNSEIFGHFTNRTFKRGGHGQSLSLSEVDFAQIVDHLLRNAPNAFRSDLQFTH